MKIQSRFKEYEVIFNSDEKFMVELTKTENAYFVIDKNVYELYSNDFVLIPKDRLSVIESIEENKIVATALEICEKITNIPAKRNATLISIGGGIIQDITGFVANITYRGIHWIFIPTTLLSACDSCIGGKTSLNYKKYKNLLGTFYPPDEIHICSTMFHTLTERDFKSGLGEVVKFNIMAGTEGLRNIEANIAKLLKRDSEVVDLFVHSSLDFKKYFIEVDEFDQNERIKLNFAHTFGHAIEVATQYIIPHGTAVAIGMIMADCISEKRGLLEKTIVKRAEKVLMQVIDIDITLLNVSTETFIDAMRKDKKQTSSSLTAVLLADYGEAPDIRVVHDLKEEEVQYAKDYFINLYEGK